MDKQKQIEEMAKIMCTKTYARCSNCSCEVPTACNIYKYAVKLFYANYRKIPEGSVVLTEEEFNEFRQTIITQSQEYTKLCNEMNDKIIKARKQAVKEVLEKISNTPIKLSYGLDAKTVNIMTATLKDKIDEIAKEFGVEVEE